MPGAILGILVGTMVLNEVPNFYLKKSIGVIAFIFGLIQVTRNTLVSRDSHG